MSKGKTTCKILKDIRRQIAEANDIEYVVTECKYKGDCKGTCPKCEAEVRYLEQQLERRRMLGKAVVVAGIALASLPSVAQTVTAVEEKPVQSVAADKKEVTGKYIVRGKVYEEFGDGSTEPVIGASLVRKEGTKRVLCGVTDVDGNFVLGLDSLPSEIFVTYIGMRENSFKVTEENYSELRMIPLLEDDAVLMGEVFIIDPKAEKKARKAARKKDKEVKKIMKKRMK